MENIVTNQNEENSGRSNEVPRDVAPQLPPRGRGRSTKKRGRKAEESVTDSSAANSAAEMSAAEERDVSFAAPLPVPRPNSTPARHESRRKRARRSDAADSDLDTDPSHAQLTKSRAVSAECGMTGGGSRPPRAHSLQRSSSLTRAERSEMTIRKLQEAEQGAEERLSMLTAQLVLPSTGPQTTAEIELRAKNSVAIVETVAAGSKNLKGNFARGLKDAAHELGVSLERLIKQNKRLEEQNAHLEAANKRLDETNRRMEARLAALERGQVGMRVELGLPAAASSKSADQSGATIPEETIRVIVDRISAVFGPRIEALAARLPPEPIMRPPLAADKRKTAPLMATAPTPCQGGCVTTSTAVTTASSSPQAISSRAPDGPEKKKKKKKKKETSAEAGKASRGQPREEFPPLVRATPLPRAAAPKATAAPSHATEVAPRGSVLAAATPTTTEEGWQIVRGRKSRGKGRSAATEREAAPMTRGQPKPPPKKRKPRRLQVPKAAAVVITVLPEGKEKGLTYEAVLKRARRDIDVSDLGSVAARTRQARTGARILEFPGADGARTADAMAERLLGLFPEESGVRVARPVKCAELRISGLDDSVTADEIREAIASKTGSPINAVRVGTIRPGPGGVGSVWASCPVAAAKSLAAVGRLLVGWSSARVTVLEPRPARCYKCMAVGHTRPLCTSCFDCSGLCFRCGQTGHKAATCTAAPFCPACAAGNRPAEHCMGRNGCRPPATGPKKGVSGSQSVLAAPPSAAQPPQRQEAMDMDLFLQSVAEWSVGVAVAAEPYSIPDRPNWVGSRDGSVAVVGSTVPHSPPLLVKDKGTGYVAAEWGGVTLYGVYFSPNRSLAAYEVFLHNLETSIRRAPGPVLVLGDFNAKSTAWGSPRTDARGAAVEEWAAAADLVLLNRGSAQTCVRRWGGSIVDLSFASPGVAARVRSWCVLEEVETLSDHRYIRIEVSRSLRGPSRGHAADRAPVFPRWAVGKLDRDLLVEAAIVQSWLSPPLTEDVGVEAGRIRGTLAQICDAAMPRVRHPIRRKGVYWWSPELADLREACIRARRSYTHSRRRRVRDEEREGQLYAAYNHARAALKLAICRAKDAKRQEMMEGLERDPWGRPYRAALNKLRAQGPPLTETLQPGFLSQVVENLFPTQAVHTPPVMAPPDDVREADEENVPPVSESEMGAAATRMRKSAAPGPDGVPARVLALVLDHLEPRLRGLFDASLLSGRFPDCWKEGKLVLLPKPGRPPQSVTAFRPIVLLDEVGKLLERVVAARIVQHLTRVGPDLSDTQFGFRVAASRRHSGSMECPST
ncbi:unnamed protein product [Euphydryas editha]|uniref:CCHC-type domain-containing protein n=1 Tax=Euphydryas editha TaxID=104508 RepID=A0AAU9V8I3_EUPED|nr:unnamed protein product [Euphydryas editha]